MRSIKDIMRASAVLDHNGIHVGGSDRESNHSYGHAYERIVGHMRNTAEFMMEVGVADGASLLAWREIFPNALCVGLDIMPDAAHKLSNIDRIEFHCGDATMCEACLRAADGRLFDLIVDDASHHLRDLLCTVYWLWPYVRPGGIYVVEEWEGVSGERDRIRTLFPNAEIVGTRGPHIEDEPLVVLRKPL